jgi:hypothetical protein
LELTAKHTGFAIALAWPSTYCKQPGAWYDPLMGMLGISRNNYYRVGHAALVLVDSETRTCHYFDFGRYHAPFNHGRVRSAETDHELRINTRPVLTEDGQKLDNLGEILEELQSNKACHGDGNLYASWCRINFRSALNMAIELQNASPIPYGPFGLNRNNCSRFVSRVLRAGKPGWKYSFRLKYLVVLTPTPMNNVNSLKDKCLIEPQSGTRAFYPDKKPGRDFLKSILPAPARNENIPENAQWLSGEGAGSWFNLDGYNSELKVTRYSPEGNIECDGIFVNQQGLSGLSIQKLRLSHPSDCRAITLTNGDRLFKFERKSQTGSLRTNRSA